MTLNEGVAKEYIVHNQQNGVRQQSFTLFTLHLKEELQYIDCNNEDFANGLVCGEESQTLSEVKNDITRLNPVFDINYPFMNALGNIGCAFQNFHDEHNNRELIVPENLIHKFEVKHSQEFLVDKDN